MTRYEKITVLVSIVALVVAATNPFVVYKWLNPPLKQIREEFKQRARLQVSSNSASDEYHMQVIRKIIMDGNDDSYSVPIDFNLEILNIGELPAKDVQIVAQYDSRTPEKPSFVFEPPSQYELVIRPNQLFLTVKRPIAAKDKLKVTFKDYPSRVSVANEFGETSTIDTQLGSFHRDAELREEIRNYIESQKPDKRGREKNH